MFKISFKQVKNITLAAAFLLCSIAAFVQPNTVYASAGNASSIGVVNYNLLMQQHPDTPQAQKAMDDAMAKAKSDFETQTAKKSDAEKQVIGQKIQQDLQTKKHDLLVAISNKINAAVKETADAKGLSTIVDKSVVIYGGQDITDDVMKKIKK
jgi:outer membrane protein